MDAFVLCKHLWATSDATIRTGLQTLPGNDLILGIATSILISTLVLFVHAFLHFLYRTLQQLRKMRIDRAKTFPFESLPRELRDMVYHNLVEDVSYSSPGAGQPTSSLNGMLTDFWATATSQRKPTHTPKPSNWMFLANKQIYSEYMDMLRKRGTFNLTISPDNYQTPTKDDLIWNIAPSTLKNIRKASLQVVATSSMLGCTDPRNMESASWTLAARIRAELSRLESCKHLTLNAKAIGDPLWNPLWIWYHSSQSFKYIGTTLSDCPTAPTLNKITFSLDTWSPGENYLERDEANKGAWTWYCMEGHNVGVDGGSEQTVRDFCGMLYRECHACRPAEEGEEETEVLPEAAA